MLRSTQTRTVELGSQGIIENIVYQGRFAAAAYACYDSKDSERNADINIFEIVGAGAVNRQHPAIALPAMLRNRDEFAAAKIGTGNRFRHLLNFFYRALGHHFTAMLACSRTDVDNLVGSIHRFLVMLNNNQRIAQIAQMLERFQQLAVIALMQADARFVQNIQHARQAAAYLRCQTDALRFAAAQRPRASVERQVIKAYVVEELQARHNLLQYLMRNYLLLRRQLQLCKELQAVAHRQRSNLADIFTADKNCQCLRLQTAAMAGRAGSARHKLLQILTHSITEGFTVTTAQHVQNTVKGCVMLLDLTLQVFVQELKLALACTIPQKLLHLGRQLIPFGVVVIAIGSKNCAQLLHKIGIKIVAEAGNAPVCKALITVRHNQGLVKLHMHAKTGAVRAGTEGIIEGKQARFNRRQTDATVIAGKVLAEKLCFRCFAQRCHLGKTVCQLQCRFHGIRQTLPDAFTHRQTVDDYGKAVLFVFLQADILIQCAHLAIDKHTHIACTPHIVEHTHMLTLAPPHQRRHHHKTASLRQLQHPVDNLLHALLLNELATLRAMRFTSACEKQTQIIVNFRYRTYGRTRIAARSLLVDGNRRAQAFDVVHIRLVHLSQKLAGVGRK